MTVEPVQDILIAVAPVVGSPRVISAAAKITEAIGITVIALEAELQAAEEQSSIAGGAAGGQPTSPVTGTSTARARRRLGTWLCPHECERCCQL